ncbi:unnamed protein product, partial [Arabidopsis halleri]
MLKSPNELVNSWVWVLGFEVFSTANQGRNDFLLVVAGVKLPLSSPVVEASIATMLLLLGAISSQSYAMSSFLMVFSSFSHQCRL